MDNQNNISGVWEKLSRLIANGVPQLQAIELVAREAVDSATKATLEALAEAIRKGRAMSEQLRGAEKPGPEPLSNAFDPEALKKNIEEMVRNTTEAVKEFSRKFTENEPGKDDILVERARTLLLDAIRKGSSDLHIIPEETGGMVQFRIDGVLHVVEELASVEYENLLSGMKRLANLDVSQKSALQTQRMTLDVDDLQYMCRMDIAPTVKGETMAIRIASTRVAELRISDVSHGPDLDKFKQLLTLPWGIVLFTGPFGSGKTTTMYSFIQEILLRKTDKVITIEDPVEFHLKGAVQLQVKESLGLTQRNLFLSARKQDPDVIMFGDIFSRDAIDMAVEVALTGHLLLSQMHTTTAIQALQQLVDMGKPWWMLRQALKTIISQRLLRHLCTQCREQYSPDKGSLSDLPIENGQYPDKLYRGVGCDACNGTGYKSRIAAYEFLEPTAALWKAISEGAPQDRLSEIAVAEGHKTLWESGWDFVLNGDTSLEELERVVPHR